MSIGKLELLRLFHDNCNLFFDALIEILPHEKDLRMLQILFRNTIPIEQAMNIFTARILPYVDLIEKQDPKFFIEGNDLFEGLHEDKVNYFKQIWLSTSLSQEDKDSLWQWFQLFSGLAINFKPYIDHSLCNV